MKTHLLRHKGERRFPCQECSMSFLTKSISFCYDEKMVNNLRLDFFLGDFRRHSRVHTGERPFSCDLCEKNFTRKETLDEHKNRHYGIKPFSCSVCNKGKLTKILWKFMLK